MSQVEVVVCGYHLAHGPPRLNGVHASFVSFVSETMLSLFFSPSISCRSFINFVPFAGTQLVGIIIGRRLFVGVVGVLEFCGWWWLIVLYYLSLLLPFPDH